MTLLHKTAFITGAAQRVGSYLVRCLLKDGWDVCIHYNTSHAEAHIMKKKLSHQYSQNNMYFVQCDLTSHKETLLCSKRIQDKVRYPIKLFIHNASIFLKENINAFSIDFFINNYFIHTISPYIFIDTFFLKNNSNCEDSSIIFILDQAIYKYDKEFFSYNCSKGALKESIVPLAQVAAPLRVNGVAPGILMPNIYHNKKDFISSCQKNLLGKKVNLQSLWHTISFLIHNHNITGQVITIDNGESITFKK